MFVERPVSIIAFEGHAQQNIAPLQMQVPVCLYSYRNLFRIGVERVETRQFVERAGIARNTGGKRERTGSADDGPGDKFLEKHPYYPFH
ncbi:hypothetical protein [Nitratireductor aquibiodomus]|uniref:hypothetical protein n=1 Tax=Nitratireductor aquibiodomus TaxID=204799 RepID=UPI0012FE12D6|nr:hypothetical protein [Nitratireductor aquibiodomus]